MRDYKSLSHTRWDCKYHIVFIPKKRKKQIYGSIRKHLGEILHELAKRKGVTIEEGHLMPDHIHMCLQYWGQSPLILTLNGEGLIRRFLQHVLPKGFMRIRHFGFLANRCRETKLEQIRQALRYRYQMNGWVMKIRSGEKAALCTAVSLCPRSHQRQWRAVALIAPKRFKGG